MMKFDKPLPMPENAVPLLESESKMLEKYIERKERMEALVAREYEAINDLCMAAAARAGRTEPSFALSADLRFLTPKE